MEICKGFYGIFNLEYWFRLGTRPKEFMGDVETWNKAEKALHSVLKKSGKEYSVAEGDGAFYGPKVDIIMKDAIGRDWQIGTIQLDFQQPQRFGLKYTAKDGSAKTPIAIHRVIYGSLERFIGILIEHFAGAFPLWLSPVQAVVLPVSEKFTNYGKELFEKIRDNKIRVEIRDTNETLGKRIREAELQKIPYVLVVGEKEETNGTVNVRHPSLFKERAPGRYLDGEKNIDELIEEMQEEIKNKAI